MTDPIYVFCVFFNQKNVFCVFLLTFYQIIYR